MANITVKNLAQYSSIVGTDLFNDTESFMIDLSENELGLQGGKAHLQTPPVTAIEKIPVPTPSIFNLP
jgi:hypothetical protein